MNPYLETVARYKVPRIMNEILRMERERRTNEPRQPLSHVARSSIQVPMVDDKAERPVLI